MVFVREFDWGYGECVVCGVAVVGKFFFDEISSCVEIFIVVYSYNI